MTSPKYQQPGPPNTTQYGMPPQFPQGYVPPGGYPIVPKKKSKAPMILGIMAVVFVLFVGGCMAILAAAGAGVNKAVDDFESSVSAAAPPAPGDSAGAPAAGDSAAPASAAGIGVPVRDGKFEFTVTKVEVGPARIGNQYLGKDAQGQFILVHLTIGNIGDVAQIFSDSGQKLFDAQGREFSADTAAAIYLDDSQSFLNEINPGNQVNGIVVFDVPKDVQPTSIELHDSIFSGGVTVSLG